jgi:hypothetical protein
VYTAGGNTLPLSSAYAISGGNLYLGYNGSAAATGQTFQSFRFYDRTLSAEEITQNTQVDNLRFNHGITVTIDGAACTDVVVTSLGTISCTTTAHTAGTFDVVVGISGGEVVLKNAFTYLNTATDTTRFIVSSAPTLIGSAGGETITFAGTNLNLVTSITIGGIACPISAQSNTSLACTTPAQTDFSTSGREVILTGPNNSISLLMQYYTTPVATVIVNNPGTWVKYNERLNISGTITDADVQNWTVSYSLSATTTPSTWTVCRSASSTRKHMA